MYTLIIRIIIIPILYLHVGFLLYHFVVFYASLYHSCLLQCHDDTLKVFGAVLVYMNENYVFTSSYYDHESYGPVVIE